MTLVEFVASMTEDTWAEIPNSSVIPYLSPIEIFGPTSDYNVWMQLGSDGVIDCESGAAGNGSAMWFHGGGHRCYGGNEVLEFSFNTLTWDRLTDPSAIPDSTAEILCPTPIEGPGVSHTYDCLTYSSITNRMYVFSGTSWYCLDGTPGDYDPVTQSDIYGAIWSFDVSTKVWEMHGKVIDWDQSAQAASQYVATDINPNNGNIIYKNQFHHAEYNVTTNTWGPTGFHTASYNANLVTDGDQTAYCLDGQAGLWKFDISTTPYSDSTVIPLTGVVIANKYRGGLAYVKSLDMLVYSMGTNQLWWIDPATGEVSTTLPDSDPIVGPILTATGVTSKFQYIHSANALVLYANCNTGVWVYKLGSPPPPPPDVSYVPGRTIWGVRCQNASADIDDFPSGTTPVAVNDSYDGWTTDGAVEPAPGVLSNDIYGGTISAITVTTQPTYGNINIALDGQIVYTDGGTGTVPFNDAFQYTITDENGTSDPATVSFIVTAPDIEPPVLPPSDGIYAVYADADDATWVYYNNALVLEWETPGGDWVDSLGVTNGSSYEYRLSLGLSDTEAVFDIPNLVQQWVDATYPNYGLFIRATGGAVHFWSSDNIDAESPPTLTVVTNITTRQFTPTGDGYLAASTGTPLGYLEKLECADIKPVMVQFDLSAIGVTEVVSSASLTLQVKQAYFNPSVTLDVFRIMPSPDLNEPAIEYGIAQNYPRDVGLSEDSAVLWFDDGTRPDWDDYYLNFTSIINPLTQITGLFGMSWNCISGWVDVDRRTGLSLKHYLNGGSDGKGADDQGTDPEPTEAFFRYYLYLGDEWDQEVQGGKWPGLTGHEDCGSGGCWDSEGNLGWSARGGFTVTAQDPNTGAGLTEGHSLVSHMDQNSAYEEEISWSNKYGGIFAPGQWYCIEQHYKLNDVGFKNGFNKIYVDGKLMASRTGLEVRTIEDLKIRAPWLNYYHGGLEFPTHKQWVYLAQIVVATEYIGPIVDI